MVVAAGGASVVVDVRGAGGGRRGGALARDRIEPDVAPVVVVPGGEEGADEDGDQHEHCGDGQGTLEPPGLSSGGSTHRRRRPPSAFGLDRDDPGRDRRRLAGGRRDGSATTGSWSSPWAPRDRRPVGGCSDLGGALRGDRHHGGPAPVGHDQQEATGHDGGDGDLGHGHAARRAGAGQGAGPQVGRGPGPDDPELEDQDDGARRSHRAGGLDAGGRLGTVSSGILVLRVATPWRWR